MALDYFLKISGIDGESEDSTHKNEIECHSWSFGETQSGTFAVGGGGGAGKVSMQDFHFTFRCCKASPKLFLACATGEHIGNAVMVARKAGKTQQEFLKVTFTDLLLSSFQTGGSGGSDEIPIDSCSFNFGKIKYEYNKQKSDGSMEGWVPVTYNLKQNKSE